MRRNNKVLRCGGVIAIVENSRGLTIGEHFYYFNYSTILLMVSFICIKALIKYNGFLTARTRGLCYLFPLTIPVLLATLILPWSIAMLFFKISVSYDLHNVILAMPHSLYMIMPPSRTLNHFWPIYNPLVTNMFLTTGLTLSVFYLIVTITLSGRIVRRVFRIVELEPSEYESLQRKIDELSKKLSIEPPKIGLVEDLRPNAFTIGYGRGTCLCSP